MTRLLEHTIALILLHEVRTIQVDVYKPWPCVQQRQSKCWLRDQHMQQKWMTAAITCDSSASQCMRRYC